MMLKQTLEDLDDDGAVYIRYHLDSSLFNLKRLHSHTKTIEQLFHDLLFADDAALIAHTERALQHITSCFAEAAQLFRLEVSLKKTEVLHQPASLEEYCPLHITISGTELKVVHQFTYLGCTITSDTKIDNRLAKSNSAFSRLYKRVWNKKHLKKGTKISVYQAIILTTLLYGSESWVTYHLHLQFLKHFHQHCLCTILNIHSSNYICNVKVFDQAEITSIEAMLLKSQLQWAGHVSRMGDHRLPKIALYGELSTGYCDRGVPKKRFKDSLKKTLSTCHIDHHQWSTPTADHQVWYCTVHQVISTFEDSCRANLREKCCRKKIQGASEAIPDQLFNCSSCGRTCLSHIGIVSHQHACSQHGQPPS